jgi:site-specific recombinase XerD
MRDKLSAKTQISLKSTNLKPEKERRAPGDEVIERFLRAAREDDTVDPDASTADQRRGELRRLRNVAILETLVSTGARIGEVMGFDVGDLLDDKAAVIRRGVGKGDKSRVVFFDEIAWFAVQAYMGETGVSQASDPIFLRHDRGAGDKIKRLSETGAQREIRRLRSQVVLDLCEDLVRLLLADHDPTEDHVAHLAARIGEDEAWPEQLAIAQHAHPELADQVYRLRMYIRQARETTAHSFRHAFATKVLSNTGDLAATQDLMGHASPDTTRRYAKLSSERLRQVHREGVKRSLPG